MKKWNVSFVLHTPDDWVPPEPYAMQQAVMKALGFEGAEIVVPDPIGESLSAADGPVDGDWWVSRGRWGTSGMEFALQ